MIESQVCRDWLSSYLLDQEAKVFALNSTDVVLAKMRKHSWTCVAENTDSGE